MEAEECSLPLPLPARHVPTLLWLDPEDQVLAEAAYESEEDDDGDVSDSSSLAGVAAGGVGSGSRGVAGRSSSDPGASYGNGGRSDVRMDTCSDSLPEAPPSVGPDFTQQAFIGLEVPQQQTSDAVGAPCRTPPAVVSSAASTCPGSDSQPEPAAGRCPRAAAAGEAAAQTSDDAGCVGTCRSGGGDSSAAVKCAGGSSSACGVDGGIDQGVSVHGEGCSSGMEMEVEVAAAGVQDANDRCGPRAVRGGDAIRRDAATAAGSGIGTQQCACLAAGLPPKRRCLGAGVAGALPCGSGGGGGTPARSAGGEECRCACRKAPSRALAAVGQTPPTQQPLRSRQPPLHVQVPASPRDDSPGLGRPGVAVAREQRREPVTANLQDFGITGVMDALRLGGRPGAGGAPGKGQPESILAAQPRATQIPDGMAKLPASPKTPPTPSDRLAASQHTGQTTLGCGVGFMQPRVLVAPPVWAGSHRCVPPAVSHRTAAGYRCQPRSLNFGGGGSGGSGSGRGAYAAAAPLYGSPRVSPACCCPCCRPRGGGCDGSSDSIARGDGGIGTTATAEWANPPAAAAMPCVTYWVPQHRRGPTSPPGVTASTPSAGATVSLTGPTYSGRPFGPTSPCISPRAFLAAAITSPVTPLAQQYRCHLCAAAGAVPEQLQPGLGLPCMPYGLHERAQLAAASHGELKVLAGPASEIETVATVPAAKSASPPTAGKGTEPGRAGASLPRSCLAPPLLTGGSQQLQQEQPALPAAPRVTQQLVPDYQAARALELQSRHLAQQPTSPQRQQLFRLIVTSAPSGKSVDATGTSARPDMVHEPQTQRRPPQQHLPRHFVPTASRQKQP